MLRYFHELDSSALEPPFHLPSEPMTVIELGAGMGATGFMLAERLLHIGRRDDRIILTDLPEVCDLLRDNLRLQDSLHSADVRVAPLAWGDQTHAQDVLAGARADGRRVTHIVCSDLVRVFRRYLGNDVTEDDTGVLPGIACTALAISTPCY